LPHCHVVASVPGPGPAVLPVVAREFEVVLFAVFVARFCPSFDEEFEEYPVVVVADSFEVSDRADERGEVVDEVVSPSLFEVLREGVGPV